MKISIITVCYNSIQTIRIAIKSVLSQVDINLEYLIIDGNSTDGTIDIIKEYAEKYPRIIKYVSGPDKGIYDAMNKGIEMATGDIIGILNSDDCYTGNDVLYMVCDEFTKSDRDAVYGDLVYVKHNKPYRYWQSGKQKSFKSGWMLPHPSFFVKKSVYEKFGTFRLDCGTAADYELLLRFFEKNAITASYIAKVFIYMSVGGSSNSGVKSRINAAVSDSYAWRVNGLTPSRFTLIFKKTSKILQFIKAKFYVPPCTPSILSKN
jgi:glycosyltransferase involved in cell wall biosynthesis